MKILVTGAGGYIGGFMTKNLLDGSHEVAILDSFERGHKKSVDQRAHIIEANLLDKEAINKVFSENKFDSVIHFAGYISMGESMQNPYLYFENNTYGALNIIEAMVKHQMNNFIFSSTAGVYGNPIKIPIPEDQSKDPTNPYGESKLMVERILGWYEKVYGFNSVCLRYFNAAGAAIDASMGEVHDPETHIIPMAIKAILEDKEFTLFGADYKTSDGTCIRDYIHVLDLVEAHVLGLKYLQSNKGAFSFNVGTGQGHSNYEVIHMIEKISNSKVKIKIENRRPGDAEELVADVSKIKKPTTVQSKIF